MKKIVIALDGHSSCGKSTMAKDLAREIGYTYVDTGAMYRAVTLYSMRNGLITDGIINEEKLREAIDHIRIIFILNPETNLPETYLNGENVEEEIRKPEVAKQVSNISALGFVRTALVKQQQEMGKAKGLVMDGRDIGTVVFPEAELKIFVTANLDVRAERRLKEYLLKGKDITLEQVKEETAERDFIDSTREESPLRQAEDAIVLDNSYLTKEEQKAWLLEQYNKVVSA